jgi:ERCC4 domain
LPNSNTVAARSVLGGLDREYPETHGHEIGGEDMRKRSTTLIKSPLAWHLMSTIVTHPAVPVLAERGGTQLRTPRAMVLVDTREQNPFSFERFEGWFAGVERRALSLGDYAVSGLEDLCVVERKDLADLVHSFSIDRAVFVRRLKRMSAYRHKLLVISAALSSVKSRYLFSPCDPNRVMQAMIAALVGWAIPFVCTETHELGEEIVASYLYQVHLYHWLEINGFERCLTDNDL